jgi:hypothetical protein
VNPEPLVRIAADWDCSALLRQTPGGLGIWDGVRFTIDPVEECDYLVVLNNRRTEGVTVKCPPSNVWCVMQEPYVPELYDWMVEGHECYGRVFTHHVPNAGAKYIRSQPMLPWHVEKSYDELAAAGQPSKTRGVSWIASQLSFLPGHRNRTRLREYLMREHAGLVDVFGRGIRPVEDKWDVLEPYRYSLAIENDTHPDYWSEKIADCYLAWTLPLYDGCTNIEDYFPAESFIRIDSSDPPSVAARVSELLTGGEWERRLPAIAAARQKVLNEYQIFPSIRSAMRQFGNASATPEIVHVPGYRWNRWKHRARYVSGKVRRGELADVSNAFVNKIRYWRWSSKVGL